jgi:hypothetical protein
MRSLLVVTSMLGLLGCGQSAGTELRNYDRSCARDSDCVAVYVGELCKGCYCPNAAISAGALANHERDTAETKKYCGAAAPAVSCVQCTVPTVRCVRSVCSW